VVRSHRHAEVILSLNYSWELDQFKVRETKIMSDLVEMHMKL